MSIGHRPRPPARHRARTTVAGVRGGRPPTDRDERVVAAPRPRIDDRRPTAGDDSRRPDPDIRSLITDPFASVGDAHERLTALESLFRERGDRRGAFLCVYARVTGAVGAAIDEGAFADPDWVTDYLVTFADLYREALLAYETGDLVALPDPWQVAFETAARGDALVVQDVVLGINAHVNYDLALALHRVGVGPDRRARYADHCAVNAVLRSLVDEVQDRIAANYAPGVADLDESFGRLDEALSMVSLAEGRDSAWRSAVALSSRFRLRRRLARWVLRTSSTGTAYLLLAPTVNRSVADALAGLERGDGRVVEE
jgi:hypothetical protein